MEKLNVLNAISLLLSQDSLGNLRSYDGFFNENVTLK